MKDPVPGYFYQEQLTLAPNPNYKEDFFEVEEVLGKKKIKNKTFYLVKYLYYPAKFNQYIPEENFKA
jgi:AAA+ superfamily predicted ATPase